MGYRDDLPEPPGLPPEPPLPEDYEELQRLGIKLDAPFEWPEPRPLRYADFTEWDKKNPRR